jgi:hypothetical protein
MGRMTKTLALRVVTAIPIPRLCCEERPFRECFRPAFGVSLKCCEE